MKTGTAMIRKLMDQVTHGELRLPEIQRGYVWKPAQVAGLIDSLYRGYPSGSVLLWETNEQVTEKDLASAGATGVSMIKPLYLLDGQQRLTSLHRVFTGHERAQVVFNVLTEKFQIESAATKKDVRWVSVHDLLADKVSAFGLVAELQPVVDGEGLTQEDLFARLDRVKSISRYTYWLEILDDLPYHEVTEIFVRVNSRGRALKDTDLALATLSARWPGVVAKLEEEVAWCREHHYQALDMAFLVRCLAALATETTSPGSFTNVEIPQLEAAWQATRKGLHHVVALLQEEVSIDNSTLIPSANALVPLVYYLGKRSDIALAGAERNGLVYWLLVAFIQSRYSSSAANAIAQDVTALRSDDPLRNLYRNLGLLHQRPEITAATLAGKGSTSPFFLLSYLAARRRKARDWWYGVPVALSHDGSYSVEYHHIHPRARLREAYGKAEINDLANLAFISDKANRKISARPPALYFEELDSEDLDRHFVPVDPDLRWVERYPDFVAKRRASLAEAMNALLESFRPSMLDEVVIAEQEADDAVSLSIQAYGSSREADDVLLVFAAVRGSATWRDTLALASMVGALDDLADGRGTELVFGGGSVDLPADTMEITLPMGPVLLTGAPEEWRKVLDRELEDLLPGDELPDVRPPSEWDGSRVPLSILDSD
ncbi:MAG: GmrSD restriction endonuclease domain-containing protein [Acidimicrobiales bacterium]